MQKKLFSILIAFLVCITVLCFTLGNISHIAPVGTKGKATVETPYYFQNDSIRWSEMTDYAVCEDILYVLYSGKEVLDCYSLDGTYLHSYSIVLGEKGKDALYASNGILYLQTKAFTFYTFEAGMFTDTYDVLATEWSSEIEALTGTTQPAAEGKYELRGASIWRNTGGVSEEIVHRPGWMAVFQEDTLMLTGAACFVALWIIFFKEKARNGESR